MNIQNKFFLHFWRLRSERRRKQGMTLVEVLISVALVSLLSFILYTSLVNGMKIWKKSQQLVIEEDVLIFFDKINRDLRNCYHYADFSFKGTSQEIAFPSLMKLLTDANSDLSPNEYVQQMGYVKYFYDEESQEIYEQRANYGMALEQEFLRARPVVSAITGFKILYYYSEDGQEVEENKVEGLIPNAIKIEVQFQDGFTLKTLTRWISIPLGR